MENFFIETNDGKKIFDVQYYGVEDKNESLEEFFGGENKNIRVLNYNLPKDIKIGLNEAFQWWAEILGQGAKNTQPVQYFVGTYDVVNADAQSISLIDGKIFENPNLLREAIQNGKNLKKFSNLTNEKDLEEMDNGEVGFGCIRIGENLGINDNDGNFGWTNFDYYAYPLAQAMRNVEITQIMFYEIGHSLGFLTNREENPHKIFIFGEDADNKNSFANHLRDQTGKKAKNGMWILTPEIYESEDFKNNNGENLSEENIFL